MKVKISILKSDSAKDVISKFNEVCTHKYTEELILKMLSNIDDDQFPARFVLDIGTDNKLILIKRPDKYAKARALKDEEARNRE